MKQSRLKDSRGTVVTIGTFDGVHRGHCAVLETVRRLARERNLKPLAITFDRHPLEIVRPEKAPRLLMDTDRRDARLRQHGVDVERVAFTEDVRCQGSEQWMRRLADTHAMKVLVLGYDNTFGSDGVEMSAEDYRVLGRKMGVEVVVAPIIPDCSSSAARRAVADGDMEAAEAILGRPFSVTGSVEHGREIGRTIGFPTANVKIDKRQLLPPAGVYCAEVLLPDGTRRKAVANLGSNPTVTDRGETRLEVHLLEFEQDLYGSTITVEFGRRLREERKFGSLDELREAIADDIAQCRNQTDKQPGK